MYTASIQCRPNYLHSLSLTPTTAAALYWHTHTHTVSVSAGNEIIGKLEVICPFSKRLSVVCPFQCYKMTIAFY